MEDIPMININFDKKCSKCGAKGVLDNGICLKCLAKSIKARKVVHRGGLKRRSRVKKPTLR